MCRKVILRTVVALLALGAYGVKAAEPITIINADFQQDEGTLDGIAWADGITNWVSEYAGVQWDLSGDPSNINAWINGGGWLETHALDSSSNSFAVASNQSITVTFDLALGGNPSSGYTVEVYSTDGDILLATTGYIDVTDLTPQTWYPDQAHTLQWLGATPSAAGFDIRVTNPAAQVWIDNVTVSNDDPDPTPTAPVWTTDPITGDSGLVGHEYTGSLAGLAVDPNWDVVTYSLDDTGTWLLVASDGTLSGIPPSTGSYYFTVRASDGALSSTATLSIEIGSPGPPVWSPNPITIPTPAFIGVPYTNSVASYMTEPDGDEITFTKQSGPSWLSVDSSTGEITGTPTEVGTEPNVFEILVEDLDGSDLAVVNITVIDGSGKIIAVLDAGGWADGSDQTVTDVSTGGEVYEGTAVFSSLSNAGYSWDGLPVNNARWNDDEFDLDPSGSNVGFYTYSNLTVGTEWEIYVSWKSEPQGNNSTAVPYSINGGDPIYVDQTVANPNDLTLHDGNHDVWFMYLGTATASAEGTVVVSVSASSGGWTVCDAIALVGTPLPPSNPVTDLTIIGPVSGGTEMVLSWTAEDKGTYGVQTNSNMVVGDGWQMFKSGLTKPGGGTITVTNAIGPEQTFYRVITE